MRVLITIGLVALATFPCGCSSSTTPPVAANDASTGGSDSSTGASDASGEDAGDSGASGPGAFVGTWARSGTFTETCPGGKITEEAITGNLVIALGTAPSSLVATQSNGCTATYTVLGSVATAAAGQPCTEATEAGVVLSVITTVTHTLTVSADGTTLTEASSDDVAQDLADGGTESCTATTTGSFAKQ